jgi:hypothetical protein
MPDAIPHCKDCGGALTFVRQDTHPNNPALVIVEFRCKACGTMRHLRYDGWKVPPGLGASSNDPDQ